MFVGDYPVAYKNRSQYCDVITEKKMRPGDLRHLSNITSSDSHIEALSRSDQLQNKQKNNLKWKKNNNLKF